MVGCSLLKACADIVRNINSKARSAARVAGNYFSKSEGLTKVDIIFIVLIILTAGTAVAYEFVEGSEPPLLPPLLITNQDGGLRLPVQEDYVLNTTLPEVPSRIMVYRVIPFLVDDKYIIDLLTKFGVSPSRKTRRDYFLTIADHQKNVVGITTTGFSYTSASAEDNKGIGLPNDDEAKRLAVSYLEGKGWLPKDKFNVSTNAASLMGWYDPTAGLETKMVTSKNVILNRQIGTMKDSNSFMFIEIGDQRKITGVRVVWPKLEPFAEYPIISPDEAFKKLKAGDIVSDSNLEGKVNKVYISYLTDHDMGDPASNYLLPVYIFEGDDDATIVYAIRDEYISGKDTGSNSSTNVVRDRIKSIKQFQMPVPERIVQLENGKLTKNITREKPEFNRLVNSIQSLLVYTQVNDIGLITDIDENTQGGSEAWVNARKLLEEGESYRVKFLEKVRISTSFAPTHYAEKDQYGNYVINAEQLFLVISDSKTIKLLYDNGKNFFVKTIPGNFPQP